MKIFLVVVIVVLVTLLSLSISVNYGAMSTFARVGTQAAALGFAEFDVRTGEWIWKKSCEDRRP